jgi:hypothetical protein
MYVKHYVHADEEPKGEKQRKVTTLLEKLWTTY